MIVSTWTKIHVRTLRKTALRMSQEEFAATLGFGTKAVQKWEQQATFERPVTGRSAEALDTVLADLGPAQRARFEGALVEARLNGGMHSGLNETEQRPPGAEPLEDDDVRRREFGKLAAAGVVLLLNGDQERIGSGDVRRMLSGVDLLEQEDQKSGGAALVDFAVQQLALAHDKIETCAYDATTGDAFLSAAGQLAVLTGWLAYDADRHPLARQCYADAMALGTEANDVDLIAHTCLYAANQSIALARAGRGIPSHALKLIDRARDLMRGRPPGRIHALIAVREAQAQGVVGDRVSFGRALATAWREMDHAEQYEPIHEAPRWLHFMTHSEIGGHEARGYGDIGDHARSVELYTAAAERQAGTRNAVHLRAWSATARAQIGDVAGALAESAPVLADLAQVSSTRTLQVMAPIRHAAEQLQTASDFRDQFDALAQKAIHA